MIMFVETLLAISYMFVIVCSLTDRGWCEDRILICGSQGLVLWFPIEPDF